MKVSGAEGAAQTQELDFSDADSRTARFSLNPGTYMVQIQKIAFSESAGTNPRLPVWFKNPSIPTAVVPSVV